MKKLKFSYDMQLEFDEPVKEHHFTVKCTPQSDERQLIEQLNIRIEPNKFLSEATDSYGNKTIYGHMPELHNLFAIHVDGIAQTGLKDKQDIQLRHRLDMFKYPTQITAPGREIRSFYKSLYLTDDMSEFDKALEISTRLYQEMSYEPGTTVMETKAEEAFKARKGVCQDYAHILISLCQLAHIPARYVVGFMKGEGESHAWVEVVSKDGIYAIDPTNDLVVNDDHIRITCGRDYNDCLINNGVFYGNAKQQRKIRLLVEEI